MEYYFEIYFFLNKKFYKIKKLYFYFLIKLKDF